MPIYGKKDQFDTCVKKTCCVRLLVDGLLLSDLLVDGLLLSDLLVDGLLLSDLLLNLSLGEPSMDDLLGGSKLSVDDLLGRSLRSPTRGLDTCSRPMQSTAIANWA